MALQISLVIATYNRAAVIDRLVGRLCEQTLPSDQWEVIVVDDGSQDDTAAVLRRYVGVDSFHFRFLTQENGGPAAARDAGIRLARAERICICDDDMELSPGYLAAHVAAAVDNPSRLVVIGCLKGSSDWRTKPLFDAVGEFRLETAHKRFARGAATPKANDMATGNVSLPRQMFLDIGGFDMSLRIDEDRELGYRLWRAGAQFTFCAAAWCVIQSDIGDLLSWQRRQFYYGIVGVEVWEKHDRDLSLNPTRALVDGDALKGLIVLLVCPTEFTATLATRMLISLGNVCQRCGWVRAGIGTYQLVESILFHRGLVSKFGSFSRVLSEAKAYRRSRGPRQPL